MRTWPKAVIFDMDGLMFDTESQIMRVWDEVGPRFGGEPMGYHKQVCMGMNRQNLIDYFMGCYGPDFDFPTFYQVYHEELYALRNREGIVEMPGLRELLAFLEEEKIPKVLASGSRSIHVMDNLARTGLTERFEHILAGDMVSRAKPDPEIFLKAAELAGTKPEETLVLEDSINGITAAYRGGFSSIWVPDLDLREELIQGMYRFRAKDLCEALEYLRSLA